MHCAVKVAPLWINLHVCFVQDVLSFSDYLASGESFTEMCDRLQPLLGSSVNLDKVPQPPPKLHIIVIIFKLTTATCLLEV